jgi:hypothetical protein
MTGRPVTKRVIAIALAKQVVRKMLKYLNMTTFPIQYGVVSLRGYPVTR